MRNTFFVPVVSLFKKTVIINYHSLYILLIFASGATGLHAQDTIASDTTATRFVGIAQEKERVPPLPAPRKPKNRKLLLAGINLAAYGGTLILLNEAWYKGYPKTSFHVFNDGKEWLQVDKVGHSWTAYNTGRGSAALWRWAGMDQKKAAWLGGLSGAAYLTLIEFLDAHSAEWGWSWADMGANVLGSGLFIAQELAWKEQRLQFKFSFHQKNYSDPDLEVRSDDLFGSSWYERMLKDYNGQTYWLSANLKSFFKTSRLPPWLNLSFGYGGDGMFGGFENIARDEGGNVIFDRRDIPRTRQFYFSPDIDLTRIQTNKKWVRTILFMLNSLKFPAPALMLDSKGKFKAYVVYF